MKDRNFLESHGVNVSKSLELFGDMETYNDTLETFLDDVDTKLNNIKLFKEQADMGNYAIVVHSLKSDAKYFGFEKLAELAYQHEMESKANNFYYVTENYDSLIMEANKIINLTKEYLGKPVEKQEVIENRVKDKAILVVDDSSIIVSFIHKIFDNEYDVLIANDGMEALNYIVSDKNNKIMAMLLDLNMPNVDGFQVLEYFKQHDLYKRIPVSIITGESAKDVIDRAFTYPIVDMLAKPFNEMNVKRILDSTLRNRGE